MKKLKKIISEAALIIGISVGTMSALMIAISPFWWDLNNTTVCRMMLALTLICVAIYTAASLHDEFRLVVRVERRRK